MTSQTRSRTHETAAIRVIGTSDAIRRVEREALLAARVNANVLITGEAGVGKAVVARFIHERSDRSAHKFGTIKCAGLPDRLIESTLFGHLQGSFAGAYRDKPGLLESVTGGTVLLEEIDAMSLWMQARLLRFLQTGEYRPIGGEPMQVRPNVRFIASTTMDLAARVAAGLFLEDLYLRLNIIRLSVPALHERREDIPALVDHFATELARLRVPARLDAPELSGAQRDALSRAQWRGNVRELKDVVQRQLLSATAANRAVAMPKSA